MLCLLHTVIAKTMADAGQKVLDAKNERVAAQ